MNILPKTEKENLKKGLKLRFIVASSLLLAASFLIGFIMLSPAYFLASGYFTKESSLNYFLKSEDDVSIKKILDLPGEIGLKLNFFQSNTGDLSVADNLSQIVAFLPSGVRLNSISLSKNQTSKEKGSTTVLISGVASNRDSLVTFSTLLKESKLFADVLVPVSSLTKDKNLPFSMNISIEN
ncbi:MAG: hypothetical protein A3A96_02890 [Candidatus Zambryskibacteria bacterium RIFCSPLOWO2_01_FULL_39_39]|uniref:Uncharacterized protein n=1 Tax=Candidatus Zambryskibacteria bacterium RIFCSPLOWO2_01_FULL_39_39 TaxID=1802758 RepID=A0A1G2TYE4_9BACT|nr:MAG: hypothetical protein A2644_00210 [Candidatus Zambryskibacteria bacterium RIFCSPHIGHO2_01_FULL_39_63]OHA94454.1 MAG: hypothetical protein A3B88_02030 [Candidatus Zambryskibacteria bacterium RIFCSPHIGHO2_02_FULL_39_19]OHA98985.1 MAG: hypothetical protein A3F20_00355 [Candidatus Zambryskibacteria bacterium RIFCSPHIGHO2_12_FULL_39_21]OHB01592.1 MAG: hypothetical protein A3A96_02890 [Candidatus Zambryskibacteria bacterium RIFCSPLOWO2_01_FULL_39_39]